MHAAGASTGAVASAGASTGAASAAGDVLVQLRGLPLMLWKVGPPFWLPLPCPCTDPLTCAHLLLQLSPPAHLGLLWELLANRECEVCAAIRSAAGIGTRVHLWMSLKRYACAVCAVQDMLAKNVLKKQYIPAIEKELVKWAQAVGPAKASLAYALG